MLSRISPVLFLGFGSLVVLIGLAGLGSARRAAQLFDEMASSAETHRESTRVFNDISSGVDLSGIYVRDYLLDLSDLTASLHRQKLLEIRATMTKELEQLERVVGPEQSGVLSELRLELDGYWESIEPLFSWTPGRRRALGSFFLQQRVLPRRDAAMEIARRIRVINDAAFETQQDRLERGQTAFNQYLLWMLGTALSLGFLVAGASIFRISRLERESERNRASTERAERELRRLSQQLVHAQEAERRSLSRELHDEVGQMLTALRMELASLDATRNSPGEEFSARLQEAKHLAEQTLVSVRDLAMGLRPAMLDDLGLGPALEWQGREFSRRIGIPVEVQVDGVVDQLPDAHRTCIFRIVQEALTNCARHARAKSIRVVAHGAPGTVFLSVQDDGVGFAGTEGRGLGLIGIEERARELGGLVTLESEPGKGTTLKVELPWAKEIPA